MLKQLQGTIEEESGEASGSQLELIERLKGKQRKLSHSLSHSLTQYNAAFFDDFPEMSLESAGFKHRTRPPMPTSSSSPASGSGAPGAAGGGPQAGAAFGRRGLPTVGRESHDRCLEELEKERYSRVIPPEPPHLYS